MRLALDAILIEARPTGRSSVLITAIAKNGDEAEIVIDSKAVNWLRLRLEQAAAVAEQKSLTLDGGY